MILSLFLSIFLIVPPLAAEEGIQPHGENICPIEQIKEQVNLKKHEQNIVVQTTEFCWDISKGFRCNVTKTGKKITYKGVPSEVKTIVYACCIGYFQTNEATCEVCNEGFYGGNCSHQCQCNADEECNNVVGCCNRNAGLCGVSETEYLRDSISSSRWLIGTVVCALLVVIILLFGTFFYRRKYIKEKDPELPTLTYHPYVREFLPTSEIESREFNNPLYRQSTPVDISNFETEEQAAIRKHFPPPTLPSNGDYASMDEVTSSTSGLSCTDPLLEEPSSYEVPVLQSRVTSIESPVSQNKVNDKRKGVL